MNAVSRHFVLAAGGTGGHLIPAFALAAELEALTYFSKEGASGGTGSAGGGCGCN